MSDYTDLIRRTEETLALDPDRLATTKRLAGLARPLLSALENVDRENAALRETVQECEERTRQWKAEAESRVAQLARAREALKADYGDEFWEGVVEARRILSDPDPSARLRAIKAEAHREVIDYVFEEWGVDVADLHERFGTEEARDAE